MTLLDRVKARIPEILDSSQDVLLEELIQSAQEIFINLRYPVSSPPVDNTGNPIIESRWHGWIISAAVELYGKQGAEGQIVHSENGINRTYESGSISSSLQREVTPVCGLSRSAVQKKVIGDVELDESP